VTARYRIVYFIPDPLAAERLAIGAIADGHDGIVLARHHGNSLHRRVTPAAGHLVEASLGELTSIQSVDDLPLSLGPQIVAGPVWALPTNVGNVQGWLEDTLFPAQTRGTRAASKAKVVRRAHEGIRFLATRHVDRFVQTNFSLPERPPLGAISQYVEGRDETLLLEPISLARPNAEKELREVYTLLAAYASVLKDDTTKRRIVYVLAGGHSKTRDRAIGQLKDVAEVVDTAQPADADHLVAQIESYGRQAA